MSKGEIRVVGVTRTNGLSARRSIFKSFSDYQAQFRITITDRNGRNLSADAILFPEEVQEIYGRGQTCDGPSFGTIRNIWRLLDWKVDVW